MLFVSVASVADTVCCVFARRDVNVKSTHNTLVVFLQNEAGFQKWGPTPDKLQDFLLSCRPTLSQYECLESATDGSRLCGEQAPSG